MIIKNYISIRIITIKKIYREILEKIYRTSKVNVIVSPSYNVSKF